MITSAEIKHIRSLREKKFRDEYRQFVVEGEKMVREARSSGMKIVGQWSIAEIGESAMAKISQFSTPSPVLALLAMPEVRREIPDPPEKGLYLALDSVRDPGNLGTIIRIADWFGVGTVFVSPDCVEQYNPKAVQASMGSIFRVFVIESDIALVCRRFRKAGMPVCGMVLDGRNIYKEDLGAEGLVVMGNESVGISAAVRAELDRKLLIPPFGDGGAESLNVAVATAVTLSEFRRRTL